VFKLFSQTKDRENMSVNM